jgi:hypothetical protein
MKTTTLATVALLATTTLAQAGVIFSDDFNRVVSTTVGNGWVETQGWNSGHGGPTSSEPREVS